MAYRKIVLGVSGCLAVLLCVLFFQADVMSMISPAAQDSARPDLIMIQGIGKQKAKEAPAVQFLHDAHTQALAEQGKDCSVCHIKDDRGVISYKYMRLEDPDANTLKNLYHDNCAGCHAKNAAARLPKTGPQVGQCRQCHVERPVYTEARVSGGMDNILHFRHWNNTKQIPLDQGQETNCGQCHHEYDKEKQELVYIKFAEEGCRSCHTAEPAGDVKKNINEAFHGQCVTCHLNLKQAEAEKTGPLDCASCHGAPQVEEMKLKNKELLAEMGGLLPRLPRKQPDAVLLTAKLPEETDKTKPTLMHPVAFNHELHEHKTEACRNCHHETLKRSCTDCHSLQGSEDGGYVSLERAMHQADSPHSCVGCHNELKNDPSCAGCHAAMPRTAEPAAGSCGLCHVNPDILRQPARQPAMAAEEPEEYVSYMEMIIPAKPAGATDAPLVEIPQDKEARAALAQQIIDLRPAEPLLIAVEDIPDIVKIDVLADEYQPSELPHRKIVLSMMQKMQDNSLATAFHATPVTMCQGCHHNSPLSKTPPSCQSCHDKSFQEGRLGRPGLQAAYHIQCMSCHKEMGLEKPVATDCYSCHKKKDNG